MRVAIITTIISPKSPDTPSCSLDKITCKTFAIYKKADTFDEQKELSLYFN